MVGTHTRETHHMGTKIEAKQHGTVSTYGYGCRCDRCILAGREADERKRTRTPAPKRQPAPYAPLLHRLSIHCGKPVDELTREQIAEACGVTTQTVRRWTNTGTVNLRIMDDVAIRLGWHPAAIWGSTWYIETFAGDTQ
jgi:hypothetical protein